MSFVTLQRARLGYGARPVFDAVSLTISPGDRVVLLGRSGAGKSTLLNALYDVLAQDGLRVALVPQDMALVPQLSVARNVFMGRLADHGAVRNLAALLRMPRAARDEIMELLSEVGIADLADRAVEGLSGGQKQRTALARAFYLGGSVLMGDEPLSALDEAQSAALLDRFGQRFQTTILTLHDVVLARRCATRLIGIRAGEIIFDAPPEAVSDARIEALYAA